MSLVDRCLQKGNASAAMVYLAAAAEGRKMKPNVK